MNHTIYFYALKISLIIFRRFLHWIKVKQGGVVIEYRPTFKFAPLNVKYF